MQQEHQRSFLNNSASRSDSVPAYVAEYAWLSCTQSTGTCRGRWAPQGPLQCARHRYPAATRRIHQLWSPTASKQYQNDMTSWHPATALALGAILAPCRARFRSSPLEPLFSPLSRGSLASAVHPGHFPQPVASVLWISALGLRRTAEDREQSGGKDGGTKQRNRQRAKSHRFRNGHAQGSALNGQH